MKALISLYAILAFIGTASAITCFICNSQLDSACGDELRKESPALRNAFVAECPQNETHTTPFCRKVKEHIYSVNRESEIRVHRECGYLRREIYDCYQKRAEDYVMDVCQCDKDLCNAAHALTPFSPILAVPLYFLAKFL